MINYKLKMIDSYLVIPAGRCFFSFAIKEASFIKGDNNEWYGK